VGKPRDHQLSLFATGAPTPDVASDPKLAALRSQMGELAFGDRIAQAQQREEVVLARRRMLASGMARTQAYRQLAPDASFSTVTRWLERYAADGLAGLVERRGLMTVRFDDPPQRRPHPTRGRKALSFVKWAGGKALVAGALLERMPKEFGTYYEPMVGAGTVFLKLRPGRAVLGDINAELVCAWEVIRDDVDALCDALSRHANRYEHYIRVRALDPDTLPPVERAARFIYLNKTCYNGLYRVNSHGRFNTPFGRKENANFEDFGTLRRIHEQLQGVRLECGAVEETVRDAGPGDLVYLDPPYLDLGRKCRTFHAYQPEAFGESAHERLAALFADLDARGCHVVLSNSDVPRVRELYRGYPVHVLHTNRTMNSRTSARRGWREVVICNTTPV